MAQMRGVGYYGQYLQAQVVNIPPPFQVRNPVTSGDEDLQGQVDLVVKKQKGITHLRVSQIQIRIHVYNADELILCALPYHDTHVFVQIVQLLDTE
ncbi:hypothetical protein CTI12_AA490310 [Artemisia annua]|uniref:Uncharacterized protein n=1 Tax=Artemisia annua TaxID=35608 RepID=A0A2U1LHM3_ARTAN|nr:hypothetical protein CTI12_AA490310 [Artemisia annua]